MSSSKIGLMSGADDIARQFYEDLLRLLNAGDDQAINLFLYENASQMPFLLDILLELIEAKDLVTFNLFIDNPFIRDYIKKSPYLENILSAIHSDINFRINFLFFPDISAQYFKNKIDEYQQAAENDKKYTIESENMSIALFQIFISNSADEFKKMSDKHDLTNFLPYDLLALLDLAYRNKNPALFLELLDKTKISNRVDPNIVLTLLEYLIVNDFENAFNGVFNYLIGIVKDKLNDLTELLKRSLCKCRGDYFNTRYAYQLLDVPGLEKFSQISDREISDVKKYCEFEKNRIALAEEKVNYDVIISGQGPAGMMAALKMMAAGKKVLLISNRSDDFVRVQKIRLDYSVTQFLREMVEAHSVLTPKDKKLFDTFNKIKQGEYIYISLKDIERYLSNRIEDNKRGDNIKILHDTQLTSVNLETGVAIIEGQTDPVTFKDLICADGAVSHAVNVLNENYAEPVIRYRQPDIQKIERLPSRHIAAYFQVQSTTSEILKLPTEEMYSDKLDGLLGYCILDFDSFENSDPDNKSIKCFVTTEISDEEYQYLNEHPEQFKENMLRLANEFIQETELGKINNKNLCVKATHPSVKHGPVKDKMKLTLFSSNTLMVEHPLYVSASGRCAIVIGDAGGGTDYRFGLGMYVAMRHVEILHEFIQHGVIADLNAEYAELQEKLRAKLSGRAVTADTFFKAAEQIGKPPRNLFSRPAAVVAESKGDMAASKKLY